MRYNPGKEKRSSAAKRKPVTEKRKRTQRKCARRTGSILTRKGGDARPQKKKNQSEECKHREKIQVNIKGSEIGHPQIWTKKGRIIRKRTLVSENKQKKTQTNTWEAGLPKNLARRDPDKTAGRGKESSI